MSTKQPTCAPLSPLNTRASVTHGSPGSRRTKVHGHSRPLGRATSSGTSHVAVDRRGKARFTGDGPRTHRPHRLPRRRRAGPCDEATTARSPVDRLPGQRRRGRVPRPRATCDEPRTGSHLQAMTAPSKPSVHSSVDPSMHSRSCAVAQRTPGGLGTTSTLSALPGHPVSGILSLPAAARPRARHDPCLRPGITPRADSTRAEGGW